jgi:hypothetical protein
MGKGILYAVGVGVLSTRSIKTRVFPTTAFKPQEKRRERKPKYEIKKFN